MTVDNGPKALMVQGTGSDVGKSLLVAGLARAFVERGLRVVPFKPQNMSNNAAVTPDGGEIGRAQALQARAARVTSSYHMNPVLLKPQSENGAQVVVHGRVETTATAREYTALKPQLLPRVLESFAFLSRDADLVLVEGAGSPAEVNLRAGDIANMGFAEAARVPVVLVADIERGGVIASIVGTRVLMSETEAALTRGFIVNKFRGDVSLFDSGIEIIAEHTEFRCFGVIPYFAPARRLPQEDSMSLDGRTLDASENPASEAIRIAVPRLSRIANFDDLDPLAAEPGVTMEIVEPGDALPGDAHLVIIPGSKATLADLAQILAEGWDVDIAAHRRRGGLVVGLCGGYQVLGCRVADPEGIEGSAAEAKGLSLLNVETVLGGDKALNEATGTDIRTGALVRGYEMHMGKTAGPDCARPLLNLDGGRAEGAQSADGLVMGTYLHGLFATDAFRHAFLADIRAGARTRAAYEAQVEDTLDALARHLEANLDLDGLLAAAGSPRD